MNRWLVHWLVLTRHQMGYGDGFWMALKGSKLELTSNLFRSLFEESPNESGTGRKASMRLFKAWCPLHKARGSLFVPLVSFEYHE